MTGRSISIVDPGAFTSVQDLGRPGLAHLGVPRSGAVDAPARDLANRLVGNEAHAAVLETTLNGVAFRADVALTIAVTGARSHIEVDGRHVPWAEPVSVAEGAIVRVGPAHAGLRSYVAVSGGLEVPAVLGSRSHDTLSRLGPAPLAAGEILPVGRPQGMPGHSDVAAIEPVRRQLVLHPGPRADWFEPQWPEIVQRSSYVVGASSNRIAIRMEGEALPRIREGELPSEGIVLGAVQVPASGLPLIFLNDHPTTGGYPVIAVADPASLAVCAQLRPGDEVSFRVELG